MGIFSRVFLGQAGAETVLPSIEDLENRLILLAQKEARIKEFTDSELALEQSSTKGFIGLASNAINIIKSRLDGLDNKIIVKTSELNITPPQIMTQVKHKQCCFMCIGNCPVYTTEPRTNPRIAAIHREIEAIQTEKVDYTGLLSRGMTIYSRLVNYSDELNAEVVDRTSLKSRLAEFFAPTEEGVLVPPAIEKLLPLALGGFLAVSMMRKPEKEKK